jgi:hypothetical protein
MKNTMIVFTRRTNDPKLRWLQDRLDEKGIPNWRDGKSFHAPILKVRECDLDAAWEILSPIDDVPDDDPQWGEKVYMYTERDHEAILDYLSRIGEMYRDCS